MVKKPRTEKQLANDKRLADQAKARREATQATNKDLSNTNAPTAPPAPVEPQGTSIEAPAEENSDSTADLKAQIELLKQNQELMMQLLSSKNSGANAPGLSIGNSGSVLGEVEKYTVDPKHYADPTARLAQEKKLELVAFNQNYELDYETTVRAYQNKSGLNMKEPEFRVTLTKIHRDGQGTDTGKRYIIKNMRFHEDPQAAIVIAREQGIDLGEYGDLENTTSNQRLFLDEMRFLRVRDWLFDIFWPKAADRSRVEHSEEVLNGTIVQTFSKPAGEPGGIDFDKLGNNKF